MFEGIYFIWNGKGSKKLLTYLLSPMENSVWKEYLKKSYNPPNAVSSTRLYNINKMSSSKSPFIFLSVQPAQLWNLLIRLALINSGLGRRKLPSLWPSMYWGDLFLYWGWEYIWIFLGIQTLESRLRRFVEFSEGVNVFSKMSIVLSWDSSFSYGKDGDVALWIVKLRMCLWFEGSFIRPLVALCCVL